MKNKKKTISPAKKRKLENWVKYHASKKDIGNQTQMMAFRLLVIAFVLVASVMAASAVGVIGGN